MESIVTRSQLAEVVWVSFPRKCYEQIWTMRYGPIMISAVIMDSVKRHSAGPSSRDGDSSLRISGTEKDFRDFSCRSHLETVLIRDAYAWDYIYGLCKRCKYVYRHHP